MPLKTDLFTDLDQNVAAYEGWGIFETEDLKAPVQLQRDDEMDVFRDDDKAWEFVILKALNGSDMHKRAIQLIKETSPDEYARFVTDVSILEAPQGDKKPWLLKFANGEALGLDSETQAKEYQALYRKAVSLI